MKVLALLVVGLAVVSAQPRWQVERSRLATILFGISYVDEFNGFVQGAQDGSGPLVYFTNDGGSSYQNANIDQGNGLFMAGAAHSATRAVAGGLGVISSGIQVTSNTRDFRMANIPALIGQTQSAGRVKSGSRDGAFGFVGSWPPLVESGSVAFSANAGATWSFHTVGGPAQARYGAYPSLTTWYVSGGTWPRNQNLKLKEGDFEVSQKVVFRASNETGAFRSSVSYPAIDEQSSDKNGYIGYISKTVDGGRTFQRVFINEGQYYFNGIDCADVNNCLAVAEGAAGAYLFGTNDGGATWTQRLFLAGRSASLFDVKFVNAREAWACGGILDLSFTGQFYRTVDGGVTWTPNPVPGVYGTTLTFADVRSTYHGHATGLTLDGQSSTLVYK